MTEEFRPYQSDVDSLMLNARLKEEIEPYIDESVTLIDTRRMPTDQENAFLASMLAWERAPIAPIREWFEPQLNLPEPGSLTDLQLHEVLHRVIELLYEKGIVLEYTDHLSDRELYCLIVRDILESEEKRVELPGKRLHWQCIDPRFDEYLWLQFYASETERDHWSEVHCEAAPLKLPLPFPREISGR